MHCLHFSRRGVCVKGWKDIGIHFLNLTAFVCTSLIVYFKNLIFFKSYFVSHKRDGITLDSDYASSHPLTLRHICVSVSVIDNYIHRAHARNISNTVILFTVRKKIQAVIGQPFFSQPGSHWLFVIIIDKTDAGLNGLCIRDINFNIWRYQYV